MHLNEYLGRLEKSFLETAIRSHGTRRDAARALGISLRSLHYKLKKYDLVGLNHRSIGPFTTKPR